MSTIGTRIKESREAKGLLQSQLAQMIGVKSAGVISNWEQDVSKPDANKMVRLCEALSISLSYLLDYYGKENAPPYSSEALKLAQDYDGLDGHGKRIVRLVADEEKARCSERPQVIPVQEPAEIIYTVPGYALPMSAGAGEPAGQEPPEDYSLKKAPPRGTSYIARVHGHSMEPTYFDGQLVFVHAAEEIPVGEIGVFFMEGQQWVKELGDGELISHNSEYPPRPITEDIRCQGLVLGVCDESYFG